MTDNQAIYDGPPIEGTNATIGRKYLFCHRGKNYGIRIMDDGLWLEDADIPDGKLKLSDSATLQPEIERRDKALVEAREAITMAKRALTMLGSEIPNLKAVRNERDDRIATPANYAAELAAMAKKVMEPAIATINAIVGEVK